MRQGANSTVSWFGSWRGSGARWSTASITFTAWKRTGAGLSGPHRRHVRSDPSWFAAHRDAHFGCEFADAFVGELSQASSRLNQATLADNRNILGSCSGIRLESRLACRQEDMCWSVLVNARREGHNENRVGSRVAISGVHRNDDHRAASLLRRINGQLDKPNFAAQWSLNGELHVR